LNYTSICFAATSPGYTAPFTFEVLFINKILNNTPMKKKVWFVTGASKGLGLSLVKKLLKGGYNVAATSRNMKDLVTSIGATTASFLPLSVDLTNEKDVDGAIQQTVKHFGALDVIVNNAGYGLAGALEELTDAEARANFEVNVFGSLNVIRKALPHLRKQNSGHIFNVSSIGGFIGTFPGFGIYCATKFAVQGFSESLSEEVKPFGIGVTIVSPGYFRTSFLEPTSLSVPVNPIADYELVREVQSVHQNQYNGNQMGDPDKAADVMIDVAEADQAPLHLFLGQDAYDLADKKIEAIKKDMVSVEDLATATAFN
jgi:NAD(P)-dependent dehydrogenase (short-subunit alcohol dehydrogenase family)